MNITLNHTILPSHDATASGKFFAQLFDLKDEHVGHMVSVRLNDTSQIYFDAREQYEPHHLAFRVGEAEFDEIVARLQKRGIAYFSDPMHLKPDEFNHRDGRRGLYFCDPSGHNLELCT